MAIQNSRQKVKCAQNVLANILEVTELSRELLYHKIVHPLVTLLPFHFGEITSLWWSEYLSTYQILVAVQGLP